MALAILKLLSIDKGQVHFNIDTGTNPFYYLKIGEKVIENNGFKWVAENTVRTAIRKNNKSNALLDTDINISVSANKFPESVSYAQLFSFKNEEGKSPAFSNVVRVYKMNHAEEFSLATSGTESSKGIKKMYTERLNPPRTIPHRSPKSHLSKQASFDDILTGIARLAEPIVMGLVSGLRQSQTPTNPSGSQQIPAMGMLNTILDALLNGLSNHTAPSGIAPAASAATPGASAAAPREMQAAAVTQSLRHNYSVNRFVNGLNQENPLSRPFIFGIDDALLASLAGPVLQALPQLLNASNQAKLQNKQANNQLITDLVGQVNRRMMLQQFIENQAAAPAAGTTPNIQQLLQLLQQAAPATAPSPTPAATAASMSIKSGRRYATTLSTTAILSFETSKSQIFCEKETSVFQRNTGIKLRVKLTVPHAAPKSPLPKAIVTFYFKDNQNKTVLEKKFREKNVEANSHLIFPFTVSELERVEINKSYTVIAEMRWLTNSRREVKALGQTELIFSGEYFLKEQAGEEGDEKELTDMTIYRAFWNKLWESPLLDSLNTNESGYRKFRWQLDTSLKYSVVVSTTAESNGLMETRLLKAENELETLSEIVAGRIKGGIELSLGELNKMATLWDDGQPLDTAKLSVLKTEYLENANAYECVSHIKLTGKKNERGLLWVIPTLIRRNIILSRATKSDEYGQVIEVTDETIRFPIPKSVRILGLKSE